MAGPIDQVVLRTCRSCELVWRVAPTDGVQLDHYREGYYASDGGYGSYFECAAEWRLESRRRLAWLRRHASPTTLLDVGCGGGFFLASARAAGMDVQGIEPSQEASRFARDELGLHVETGFFEDTVVERSFDALCAFHVLEHVADPRAFLARAASCLTKDGVLAIEVPNIASAGAEREGPRWPSYQPEYHLWQFNPRSLARHVESAGLSVVAVDTVFPRVYARLFGRVGRPAMTVRDVRVGRTLRLVHPERGDFLRLVARRAA